MKVNGMKKFLVHEKSSGKSSHDEYKRSVLCVYQLILYTCIMHMFMIGNVEGYISELKAMWPVTCWDKHG